MVLTNAMGQFMKERFWITFWNYQSCVVGWNGSKKSLWEIFSKIFCEEWCLIIKLNVFLDLGYKSIFDSIIIKFIMLENLVWVLLEKCNNSLTVLFLSLFSNFNYYLLSFKKMHACGCVWACASVSAKVFRVWKRRLFLWNTTVSCEEPYVGVRSITEVLCKSSMCLNLSHPSSSKSDH